MLDDIKDMIDQCFEFIEVGLNENEDIKETSDYKCASILISTYNKFVKLYYAPIYVDQYLKRNVAIEYKLFLQSKAEQM